MPTNEEQFQTFDVWCVMERSYLNDCVAGIFLDYKTACKFAEMWDKESKRSSFTIEITQLIAVGEIANCLTDLIEEGQDEAV